MATPRASGFWAESHGMSASNRTSYFQVRGDDEDEDEDVEEGLIGERDGEEGEGECDGRTPLDRTIDRIGMGPYQWTLLSLCGFGWLADNMWIEAIAIILPRVQRHYDVPDNYIGTVSSSMFAGMMFGAIGWGTCSDLMGRSTAFNATLFFTSVFGLLASFANSFGTLCVTLFLLGSAVGGSMPTDGTLLLEHMPKSKQYLVTALSVFFSFGAVLSAVVGLLVIPQHSCIGPPGGGGQCDVDKENQGWRYLLIILGVITLAMFLARMVFFRLHESPRYLVHAGRPLEAIESLQMISRFNGSNLSLGVEDVSDSPVERRGCSPPPVQPNLREGEGQVGKAQTTLRPGYQENVGKPRPTSTTIFNVTGSELDPDHIPSLPPSRTNSQRTSSQGSGSGGSSGGDGTRPTLVTQYNTTGDSENRLEGRHAYWTPKSENPPSFSGASAMEATGSGGSNGKDEGEGDDDDDEEALLKDDLEALAPARPRPRLSTSLSPTSPHRSSSARRSPSALRSPSARSPSAHRSSSARRLSSASRRMSIYEKKMCWRLPRWIRRPLWAWWDRVMMVLSPEWIRTTLLVWAVWTLMSLAFTMFNVYLPKLLETGGGSGGAASVVVAEKSLDESLWDVVIFTLGGCPGALIGAYFVESSLGRKWSLAGSTFITAFFCIIFIMVESSWAVRVSTVGISVSATAMWAVLYGWTPEIFGTKVRGTACGIASAVSRIGGMIAPMLGGILLMMDRSIPVYTSVVVFFIAGVCVLFVPEPEGGETSKERTVLH